MIARLVAWSVAHRVAVAIVTGVLTLAGLVVGARLQFDALPDITTNQVLVLTRAPGLTPEEVERRVTRPLETSLGGLPGLVELRSLSRYGISSVTTVFEDGVDTYRARQLVKERLDGAAGSLPAGVESPELGPVTGGLGEIFHLTLSSERRTAAELLELATLRASPLLRAAPGVVEVNTWGGEQRTLEVRADPIRMAQRGLTLADLRTAISDATGTASGASVPAGSGQSLLRAVALPRDPSDLGNALVQRPGRDGPPVRLAEVADVVQGALPRIGAATANGQGETVYLMVQMLRGANAVEVMQGVHAQLEKVRPTLPPDVRVEVVYDRSTLVAATVRTVVKNLVEGGLLVMAVLFLMLGSWRAGLVVASAIPLSMLGATAGMVALGIPGNLMSLGAIDFGLVVDGAVVMVEAIFHGVSRQAYAGLAPAAGRRRFLDHVSEVTTGVARPVFFSVLVILLVYVPVLSLVGADGKMFRPMALTVVFALLTSLVLSLTFVPAAAALFLRPADVPLRPPPLVRLVDWLYRPLLGASTARPAAVAAGAALLLGLGGLLMARAGSEFVPQLDEGDLVIQTTRAADISLESAVREAGRLEAALLAHLPGGGAGHLPGRQPGGGHRHHGDRAGRRLRDPEAPRRLAPRVDPGGAHRRGGRGPGGRCARRRAGLHPAHPDALQRAPGRLGRRRGGQHLRRGPGGAAAGRRAGVGGGGARARGPGRAHHRAARRLAGRGAPPAARRLGGGLHRPGGARLGAGGPHRPAGRHHLRRAAAPSPSCCGSAPGPPPSPWPGCRSRPPPGRWCRSPGWPTW